VKVVVCVKQVGALGDEVEFTEDERDVDPDYLDHALNEWDTFATEEALQLVERYTGVRLVRREVPEGTLLAVSGGRIVHQESFTPDRSFTEQLLPAVRAPQERSFCLARLAAIAAPAAGR